MCSEEYFLDGIHRIYAGASKSSDGELCCVAPSPDLQKKLDKTIKDLRKQAPGGVERLLSFRADTRVGFNDGLIVPGTTLPLGTPPAVASAVALERAPLRGTVNVVVVLVDFSDRQFGADATTQHFRDLFFSTGVIATKSVKEYYTEATNGLVTLSGQVVGPFRMPHTLAHYANNASGTGNVAPNARNMADDAARAANASVNFANYDNNGDGYVDAFVIVHAGGGAEQTGSAGDIWSHKWVLPSQLPMDGTRLYAYLTIPEDARIGVCAHELGHLLFGFPDLYDTDYSSSGVGNWCLMGGGSWNGGGDTPAHPSAWCKANQNWVTVTNVTSNGKRTIDDVKTSHEVLRLWKDGAAGQEYFLVENRQRAGFDAKLPADGLLVWHIDDATPDNSNEKHPRVALVQADGLRQLEDGVNRGDPGDPYPGSTKNTTLDFASTPSSKSYAGSNTSVSLTAIAVAGSAISVNVAVKAAAAIKYFDKPMVDKPFEKPPFQEKTVIADKAFIGDKTVIADKGLSDKPIEKPVTDKLSAFDKGFDNDWRNDWRFGLSPQGGAQAPSDTESRLARLEAVISRLEPVIDASMRPDLSQSALQNEPDAQQQPSGDKRLLDRPGYQR